MRKTCKKYSSNSGKREILVLANQIWSSDQGWGKDVECCCTSVKHHLRSNVDNLLPLCRHLSRCNEYVLVSGHLVSKCFLACGLEGGSFEDFDWPGGLYYSTGSCMLKGWTAEVLQHLQVTGFWLLTECQLRAYAIMICLLSSSSLSLLSVSTPPDHMLGQIRFILCMHMQLYPV